MPPIRVITEGKAVTIEVTVAVTKETPGDPTVGGQGTIIEAVTSVKGKEIETGTEIVRGNGGEVAVDRRETDTAGMRGERGIGTERGKEREAPRGHPEEGKGRGQGHRGIRRVNGTGKTKTLKWKLSRKFKTNNLHL